jgi:hypothetical protein
MGRYRKWISVGPGEWINLAKAIAIHKKEWGDGCVKLTVKFPSPVDHYSFTYYEGEKGGESNAQIRKTAEDIMAWLKAQTGEAIAEALSVGAKGEDVGG